MASCVLLTLTLVLQLVSQIWCVLDFTCYNSNPRLDVDGDNNLFIGGYKSGDDTDATVTFGRTSYTFTGNDLPPNSYQVPHGSNPATLLRMPSSDGGQRIGAFYCEAQKDRTTERITTIITDQNSHVTPQFISKTVNMGESVTLSVDARNNQASFVWWHDNNNLNGQGNRPDWRGVGSTSNTIHYVAVDDAGIYEVVELNQRPYGKHAIFQLIVRACPGDTWGAPQCQSVCPQCYNGGICDDRSGGCVCAPGFSGVNCERVHGRNKWGQDGQLTCSGTDDHGYGCRENLFCLPHPYGCSCAAGFKRIDCNIECEEGFYGANCQSECHCDVGVPCLKDTGECNGGQCLKDWYGVNCQDIPQISNLLVTPSGTLPIAVQWSTELNTCQNIVIEFYVAFTVTSRLESCVPGTSFSLTTRMTSTSITYFHYSSYSVSVTPRYNALRTGQTSSRPLETPESSPSFIPSVTTYSGAFSWDAPPCDQINGAGLRYQYELRYNNIDDSNNLIQSMETISTSVSSNNLVACTSYKFRVKARNNNADGVWSSYVSYTTTLKPGPVISLNVTPTSSSSELRVTWQPSTLTEDNCRETSYNLEYKLLVSDQCQEENHQWSTYFPSVTALQATLSGLNPYSKYSVRIFTSNAAGEGPSSIAEGHTTHAVPSHIPTVTTPSVSASLNGLTFSWDAAPCGQRRGSGLRYEYQLSLNGNIEVPNTETSSTSVTIDNLTECTTYVFLVRASNDAGVGGWSSDTSATTRTMRPGPVISLNVAPTSSSSELRVTWQPSTENNCRETSYKVEYKLLLSDQCQEVNHQWSTYYSSVTAPQATLAALIPYSKYSVRILTRNTAGEGPSSVAEGSTASAETTHTPTVNTPSASTSFNGLSFSWDATPCGQRRGSGLRYEYQLRLTSNNIVVPNTETSITSVTIDNLEACTTYKFRVRASNDVDHGRWSSYTTTPTRTIRPGQVNTLLVESTDMSSELQLTWHRSSENNCRESSYIITYQLLLRDQCQSVEDAPVSWTEVPFIFNGAETTLSGLLPHSTYSVSVAATNTEGNGEAVLINGETGISSPGTAPSNIEKYNVFSNSFGVRWLPPTCGSRNGPILLYKYSLQYINGTMLTTDSPTESNETTFQDLTPFTNYTFKVAAETDAGIGPEGTLTILTNEAVPSPPERFRANVVTQTSIEVTWDTPRHPNGIITKYLIQAAIVEKPYDPTFMPSDTTIAEYSLGSEVHRHKFSDLMASTKYEFNVTAGTSGGLGNSAVLQQSTDRVKLSDIPTPPPLAAGNFNQISETTAEIEIGLPTTNNEYVSGYFIGVQETPSRRKRQSNGFDHYSVSTTKYIAAELPKTQQKFVVGDNETHGGYYNPPLMLEKSYQIYTAYVSKVNDMESVVSWSPDGVSVKLTEEKGPSIPLSIPIIAIIVVVAIFVVAVSVILIKRKRKRELNQRNSPAVVYTSRHNADPAENQPHNPEDDSVHGVTNNTYVGHRDGEVRIPGPPPPSLASHRIVEEAPPPLSKQADPIALDMFEEYVLSKKEGVGNAFAADFKTLPGDDLFPWYAAKKKENIKKNRYKNITTYDNSRVVLERREGDPHSDYINASFIDGVYNKNKYVASQGPNKESVDDFWRMIWQYKIKKVVMLTMLIESGKIKCQQYWPSEKVVKGGITITPNKEEHFAHFIIRCFRIEQVSSGEAREFRQFHFISWPDMNVPECPALINFMNVVNSYEPDDDAPPLIHCSAGVGRTGTYITIDAMREQARKVGTIDVYDFVSKMRQKRMKMVQTTAQYRFIFDALVEYIHCGDTLIQRENFNSDLKKLRSNDRKSGVTGLKKQFQTLEKVTELPTEDKCTLGLDPSNRNKNRFQDILPLDQCRPFLTTELEGSTNYINGAYVDGCRFKDQFLVTQTPLPETIADIWRMVYDHNSNAIVMLNELDSKDPTTIKYWPDRGSTVQFGPITVKGREEDTTTAPGVVIRTFHITNQRERGKRTVRQFVLGNWPAGKDSPSKPDTLLDLINCLKQYYERDKLQRITVHCIDGVGASCVFCTIMSVIDQLQYNQTIDIFHIIRRIRMARPQAIRNLAQYTFCYKAIQTYLQSTSDVYENFNQQQEPAEDGAQIYANVNTDGTLNNDGQIYANV